MKKLLILLLLLGPGTALAFDPDHLKKTIRERNCIECDLTGADLAGLDLSRGDFTGADFTFAYMVDTNFFGTNLKGARFGYNFFEANPANQGTRVGRVEKVMRSNLGDNPALAAEMLSALWDTSYTKTVAQKGTQIRGANFEGANLEGCNFVAVNLRGAKFNQAFLRNADFSYSLIPSAHFQGAYLKEAVFYKADLSSTDFSGADMSGAMLYQAVFQVERALLDFKKTKLGGVIWKKGEVCLEGSLGKCDF